MTVTRTTPARRARARARKTSGLGELIALLAASLTIAVGLFLVYKAKTFDFEEVDRLLKEKRLLNLNETVSVEQLLPFLSIFSNESDRRFAAKKIHDYLRGEGGSSRRAMANIGELSRIRITEQEITSQPKLDLFKKRLDESKKNPSFQRDTGLALLTGAQLAELKPSLVVRAPSDFRRAFLLYASLFFVGFYAARFLWRRTGLAADRLMLALLHALAGVGLILMASMRDPLRDLMIFADFALGVLIGCAAMALFALPDYQRLERRRLTFLPLAASLILSALLILFGSGPGASDAKVNLLGFQPVEAIKVLIVFFLAGYFAENWEMLRELKTKQTGLLRALRRLNLPRLQYILPVAAGMAVVLGFFFLQKDLGPALVLSCLFLALYGVARSRALLVALALAAMVGVFWAGYAAQFPQTVSQRIDMWLSPWDNTAWGGDQLAHSMWSLATGGVTGTGPGLGDPAIVPAAHTDLILSAAGEEMGFIGLLVIFALYAMIVYRGIRIAARATGDYTFFLALGLTLITALQIALIAGGILGLLPLSGVVSPFLSYGRSSMLANFVMFGILMSVSSRPGAKEQSEPFRKPINRAGLILAAIAVVILARAAYVQAIKKDDILIAGTLAVQADGARRYQYNPRILEIARHIGRGNIYDRNAVLLATSRWEDLEGQRQQYAQAGVSIDGACSREDSRHYPFGGLIFHLLGDARARTNWAARNTSFTERDSNARLQGYDDRAEVVEVKDPRTGEATNVAIKRDYSELIPLLRHRHDTDNEEVKRIMDRNRDVRMSIDIRLQKRVAEIMEKYVRLGSRKGAAVVMDVETGDLLASVSYPFPESLPAKDEGGESGSLLDRARYGIYPPGSTFKLVTAIAALRKSRSLIDQIYNCESLGDGRVGHRVPGYGRPIRDDIQDRSPHGRVNMENGVVHSCNAYFAQLGTLGVGPQSLLSTAEMMGIEVAKPNTAERLRDALPQAAYGQGQVVVTPFEMARVAATIANGGRMPYGRWVIDESNTRTEEPRPILSRDLAVVLADFMRGVVLRGTARGLSGAAASVAGKTGTAEVEDRPSHSWFAGFAPYNAGGRRIAFCVIVENGQYGARAAVPTAREIVAAARDLDIIR
ncbi:MAG: FtsW/RodA/SpoVE family cell cycle protein [Acidobacteriota bacterium]